MDVVRIRVLGRLDVEAVDLTRVDRRARRLLGLLALRAGAPVSADALIDALWVDELPSRPTSQLSVLVSRLRALVGRGRIERQDAGYSLRFDWLDLSELLAVERRLSEASVAKIPGDPATVLAHQVLELTAAEPAIDGLGVGWVEADLAAVRRLQVRTAVVAAEAMLQARDWPNATELAHRSLDRDPYNEAALRIAMRSAQSSGETARALAMYAEFRRRVADELGADPDIETERLHTRLLIGETTESAVPNRSRPQGSEPRTSQVESAPTRAFVGRRHELEMLDAGWAAADAGDTHLVVLRGEPGIGKTSLAREFVRLAQGRGSAIWWASCDEITATVPLYAVVAAVRSFLPDAEDLTTLDQGDAALLRELAWGSALEPERESIRDEPIGPRASYTALDGLVERLGERAPVVFVIDDAHHLDPASAAWLRTTVDRRLPVLVVATLRSGYETPLPFGVEVDVAPLTFDDACELVVSDHVEELWKRSGGNPLFLTALDELDAPGAVPESVAEIVGRRCEQMGESVADTLRAAALVGDRFDVDLLAVVTGSTAVDVARVAEAGARAGLVDSRDDGWHFRHQLVREALADRCSAGTRALVHRNAARFLDARADADPAVVARHAQLGGQIELAVNALVAGAARAGNRFDHEAAEGLLDDAIALDPARVPLLERARVRTRRGNYPGALADVTAAMAAGAGAEALETGAWAAYFGRDFVAARRAASDGILMATDPTIRMRCRIAQGRIDHASGALSTADDAFDDAVASAQGVDLVVASAWQGVVRAHQGRFDEAIDLLSAATRPGHGAGETAAMLHALLFLGHAQANLGLTADALDTFERYTSEVERRSVPRFAGRGVNFAGWVLRNIGAVDEGIEMHRAALEAGASVAEVRVAASQDLADAALVAGDLDGCRRQLDDAARSLAGDLVFGWRLAMRQDLLRSRLELAAGDASRAATTAGRLADLATSAEVPRYAAAARLVQSWASAAMGAEIDDRAVDRDLDTVEQVVAVEAWWMTAETACDHRRPELIDRAFEMSERLAANAGDQSEGLRRYAHDRITGWRGSG